MRGDRVESIHRLIRPAFAAGLLLALLPGAGVVGAEPGDTLAPLPRCREAGPSLAGEGVVLEPWQAVLDEEGVVVEHRLVLQRGDARIPLRAGPRSFALSIGQRRLLLGERSDAGTRLVMIDVAKACWTWARQLDRLAYTWADEVAGGGLRLRLHEPLTRRYEGTLRLDTESGASGGIIDGECITECEPNDGDVSLAAYAPAGPPRPVPSFSGGAWPRDKLLRFRWHDGAVPPAWAKKPLKAAAEDARSTARARSPRFRLDSSATDSVRYTSVFPSYCRTGIACAARSMPAFWAVWLRPHGTDFSWGSLRWCQKHTATGCFDMRRVMLHELGHIAGLNHPSVDGSPLGTNETVMHAITPAKPRAGSSRHAFGRCDVATLQELYDVPDNKTAISTCNDVATRVVLARDRQDVPAGGSVTLTAELRVDDRSAYGQLAGNPLNGRSLKLKYRRAGSDDAWQTAWMRSLYSKGRYELTIAPQQTWEFKAVFPAPADEGLRHSSSETVRVRVRR